MHVGAEALSKGVASVFVGVVERAGGESGANEPRVKLAAASRALAGAAKRLECTSHWLCHRHYALKSQRDAGTSNVGAQLKHAGAVVLRQQVDWLLSRRARPQLRLLPRRRRLRASAGGSGYFWPAPAGRSCAGALQELLKTKSIYSGVGEITTREEYDAPRINIIRKLFAPVETAQVAPESVRDVF